MGRCNMMLATLMNYFIRTFVQMEISAETTSAFFLFFSLKSTFMYSSEHVFELFVFKETTNLSAW